MHDKFDTLLTSENQTLNLMLYTTSPDNKITKYSKIKQAYEVLCGK